MIARIVLAVTLAACVACVAPPQGIERRPGVPYGALVDHGFAIAPVPAGKVPRKFMRQVVPYGTYAPGTIVVDPAKRFVYFVMPSGRALRYGVSVGVGAFGWSGEAVVGRKEVWPRWTPPTEMVRRSPDLVRYERGLEPGPLNPLGARALYLYQGGQDTLYRLHGTSEWWDIGRAVSSGCIRLLNQDMIDLFDRVPVGAKVVVLPDGTIPRRP